MNCRKILAAAAWIIVVVALGPCQWEARAESNGLKIGFVYVGPTDDMGWSHAHEQSRLHLIQKYPDIETIVAASVSAQESAGVMENMIHKGARAIFATSFDYGPAVMALASKYPRVQFFHCSGTEHSANVTTYYARAYQPVFLSGALAASLSKSGTIGYLGSKANAELIRQLNAFALGGRRIKPEIRVKAAWTRKWYNPKEAVRLANKLAEQGVDILLIRTDSDAGIQVAMKRGIYAIGFHTDMNELAPKNILASVVWNWDVFYDDIIPRLKTGTWRGRRLWWGMDRGAVSLKGFNAAVPEAVAMRVRALEAELKGGRLSVFEGPLYDAARKLRLPKGSKPDDGELLSMDWSLYGVQANLPVRVSPAHEK